MRQSATTDTSQNTRPSVQARVGQHGDFATSSEYVLSLGRIILFAPSVVADCGLTKEPAVLAVGNLGIFRSERLVSLVDLLFVDPVNCNSKSEWTVCPDNHAVRGALAEPAFPHVRMELTFQKTTSNLVRTQLSVRACATSIDFFLTGLGDWRNNKDGARLPFADWTCSTLRRLPLTRDRRSDQK